MRGHSRGSGSFRTPGRKVSALSRPFLIASAAIVTEARTAGSIPGCRSIEPEYSSLAIRVLSGQRTRSVSIHYGFRLSHEQASV